MSNVKPLAGSRADTECPLTRDAWKAADDSGVTLPESFRFYCFEAIGNPPQGLMATGCDFRAAKRGPSKGLNTIAIPHTKQQVFVVSQRLKNRN